MNGTTLERPDVAAYLDAVRSRLADLPTEERDDLVADVEASLLESGEPPLLSPEEFAAELRDAAGLSPEAPIAPAPSPLDACDRGSRRSAWPRGGGLRSSWRPCGGSSVRSSRSPSWRSS